MIYSGVEILILADICSEDCLFVKSEAYRFIAYHLILSSTVQDVEDHLGAFAYMLTILLRLVLKVLITP